MSPAHRTNHQVVTLSFSDKIQLQTSASGSTCAACPPFPRACFNEARQRVQFVRAVHLLSPSHVFIELFFYVEVSICKGRTAVVTAAGHASPISTTRSLQHLSPAWKRVLLSLRLPGRAHRFGSGESTYLRRKHPISGLYLHMPRFLARQHKHARRNGCQRPSRKTHAHCSALSACSLTSFAARSSLRLLLSSFVSAHDLSRAAFFADNASRVFSSSCAAGTRHGTRWGIGCTYIRTRQKAKPLQRRYTVLYMKRPKTQKSACKHVSEAIKLPRAARTAQLLCGSTTL